MLTVRLFQSRSAYKLLYHHSNVIFYLTLTQNYPQMGPYVRLHTLSVRHRARLLDYTSEITYTNSRCGLVLPHCRHEGRVGGQVLLQTPTNLAYIINDRRGRTLLKKYSPAISRYSIQPYLEEQPQLHYNVTNRQILIEKTVDLNDREF